MKKFIVAAAMMSVGISAQAAEVAGITVNGEVGFDYQSLSGGTASTNAGFADKATHEAYRFGGVTMTFSKDGDVFFNGRSSVAPATTDGSVSNATLDHLEVGVKVMPNLSISAGRLQTTLGYEAIDRSANALYTYSHAYNLIAPFYFEGLRAKYQIDGIGTLSASTYNNTAATSQWGEKANTTKSTELSLTGTHADVNWFAGYLTGTDANRVALTTTSLWASRKFDAISLAVTYDAHTSKAENANTEFGQSAAVHAGYAWNKHNFAARYEMVYGAKFLFNNLATPVTVNTKEISSIVIGDKYAMNDNLKLYADFRMDSAKDKVYADNKGEAKKSASSFTLGAIAHF